ncbi:MAG: peptide ABC transporter substrate-binding protein [Shackletoniella antarctica]|uniref:Peptide ABC transporter substrate-binding protein n=1 Tax=Shackletoniella antarctica TaxID=268115 RepID=A0A2W4Y7E9_9CYAN|nr:MAG: peptide ABC transporter substrate-binding protein [Shackletoniella antarctica]
MTQASGATRTLHSAGLWGNPIKRLLSLALLLVLSLTTTGCNLSQFAQASADVPRLVLSVLSDPKTFNPVLSQESPNIFSFTFEGLTTTDGVSGETVPALAESWEIEDEGKILVFTLRDGLRWSDGEPLTVDDVLFTYDVLFNPDIPTNSRDGFRIGTEGLFPEVSKLDERRVQFTLPEPFAPMLENTSLNIIPAHILQSSVDSVDAQGNPLFLSTWGTNTPPSQIIVNGPYRLTQYVPGERVIFERNPYYWRQDSQGNSQPYIEQIVWQIVSSTDTAFFQFRSGGLDSVGVQPDFFSLLKREEERGNFTIYNGGPGLGTNFLAFNLNRASRNGKPLVDPIKSAWFNSVAFRQAVSYGIDRATMVNNIFQGLGEPQTSPISVPSPFYAPPEMGIRTYDYDLEKAKELLVADGFQYNPAGELLDAAGNRVRFTLITNSGNKIRESIGAQIKNDLEKLGMQVDFQPLAFNALVDRLTDSLEWDAFVLGLTGGLEPNGGANVWLLDGALHAFNQNAGPGQAPLNGWQAADWERRIADIYVQAAQVIDEDERFELYKETQQLTQDYLPFIYLINNLSLTAVRNRVEGVKYTALGGALWNIHELSIED